MVTTIIKKKKRDFSNSLKTHFFDYHFSIYKNFRKTKQDKRVVIEQRQFKSIDQGNNCVVVEDDDKKMRKRERKKESVDQVKGVDGDDALCCSAVAHTHT